MKYFDNVPDRHRGSEVSRGRFKGGSMVFHKRLLTSSAVLALGAGFLIAAHADFFPHRICKIRTKQSLNQGWKFIKSDPANAQTVGFDDAAWQTVNVPHSAQYDPPTAAGEQSSVPLSTGWNGVHWYRKNFTVPSAAAGQKVFLEFDGAMQMAQVYLNGTLIGTHDACGYTGFGFDISSTVLKSGTNVLAVRLDCRYRDSIPPGRPGTYTTAGDNNNYPDFFLFSGLYRDVWLVCTDSAYVMRNGQKISTPTATTTSGTVRVRTTVKNEHTAAKTVIVAFCIVNSSDAVVATYAQAKSVAAGASVVFDTTTAAIANPSLWSPESPTLYRVFTKVTADGVIVDDFVERFGFRTISFSRAGGFYLNGSRYLLKGSCVHQTFAWVENAVPHSRVFEDLRLVKSMGVNTVRCSHYPRSPVFYNACDELGLLVNVEIPTWGCCGTHAYPAGFWTRLNTAAQEMIAVGYNHPSIFAWGIFNEPDAWSTYAANLTTLNTTIKTQDSTRYTMAFGSSTQITSSITNLVGNNYTIYPNSGTSSCVGSLISEYYEGWIKWCYRGDTSTTNDAALSGKLSENRAAADRWSGSNNWNAILTAWNGSTQPVPGGGYMWSFVDYWSPVQDYPMGVVDEYRIPKKSFYLFRYNWAGTAQDTFVVGITPNHVQLDADLTAITADSTDITRIVASLRDAQGRCAFVARPVTLTLTGPADCFDTLTRTTIAGKIGWVLKSRNTAGTITAIAGSSGLTPDTVIITSTAPDNSPLPFIWPPTGVAHRIVSAGADCRISMKQNGRFVMIRFSSPGAAGTQVSLLNVQGRTAAGPVDAAGRSAVTIDAKNLPSGCYFLYAGGSFAGKVMLAGRRQ
jgi:beta-galactosidase